MGSTSSSRHSSPLASRADKLDKSAPNSTPSTPKSSRLSFKKSFSKSENASSSMAILNSTSGNNSPSTCGSQTPSSTLTSSGTKSTLSSDSSAEDMSCDSPLKRMTPFLPSTGAPQLGAIGGNAIVTRSRVGSTNSGLLGRSLSKTLQSLESISSSWSEATWTAPDQTAIIFDWDDTLCPSHVIKISQPVLHYFKPCPNDPKYKIPLAKLSAVVIKTLRLAVQLGKVFIITNAQPGWVETSCHNFLPGVWNCILDLDIDIVYAREYSPEFQSKGGSSRSGSPKNAANKIKNGFFEGVLSTSDGVNSAAPANFAAYDYNRDVCQQWKERAMVDYLSRFYSRYENQSWKNVISIGDQMCEHNAVKFAAGQRPTLEKNCRIKTLKLLEAPSIDCLSNEVSLIFKYLKGLTMHNGDVSLDMRTDTHIMEGLQMLSDQETWSDD